MDTQSRLQALLNYFGLSIGALGREVGQVPQTFYDIKSGKIKSFSLEVSNKITERFPEISFTWLTTGKGEMIEKPDKKTEALQQLSKVQNGKQKNSAEGRMVPDEEVIQIKTYLIPIKGFSGLKNALFDDIYISENFDQTTTEVPKEYYASTSYKIQSTGQSMPLTIPEGAWVTGVPIPQMDWLGYKFREDKVYVLFHHIKGILFKRVKNIPHGNIRLMSENPDKEEYPDEDFDIREFKKICIAIKVETFI